MLTTGGCRTSLAGRNDRGNCCVFWTADDSPIEQSGGAGAAWSCDSEEGLATAPGMKLVRMRSVVHQCDQDPGSLNGGGQPVVDGLCGVFSAELSTPAPSEPSSPSDSANLTVLPRSAGSHPTTGEGQGQHLHEFVPHRILRLSTGRWPRLLLESYGPAREGSWPTPNHPTKSSCEGKTTRDSYLNRVPVVPSQSVDVGRTSHHEFLRSVSFQPTPAQKSFQSSIGMPN